MPLTPPGKEQFTTLQLPSSPANTTSTPHTLKTAIHTRHACTWHEGCRPAPWLISFDDDHASCMIQPRRASHDDHLNQWMLHSSLNAAQPPNSHLVPSMSSILPNTGAAPAPAHCTLGSIRQPVDPRSTAQPLHHPQLLPHHQPRQLHPVAPRGALRQHHHTD